MAIKNVNRLKLELAEVIQKWIATKAEDAAFGDLYFGDQTEEYMANAAFSVLEAMSEAQARGIENNDLVRPGDE